MQEATNQKGEEIVGCEEGEDVERQRSDLRKDESRRALSDDVRNLKEKE